MHFLPFAQGANFAFRPANIFCTQACLRESFARQVNAKIALLVSAKFARDSINDLRLFF
jgi:hypothetical protein